MLLGPDARRNETTTIKYVNDTAHELEIYFDLIHLCYSVTYGVLTSRDSLNQAATILTWQDHGL